MDKISYIDNKDLSKYLNWFFMTFYNEYDEIQYSTNDTKYYAGLQFSHILRVLIERNLCDGELDYNFTSTYIDKLIQLEKISVYFLYFDGQIDDNLIQTYISFVDQILITIKNKLLDENKEFKPCFFNLTKHKNENPDIFADGNFEGFSVYYNENIDIDFDVREKLFDTVELLLSNESIRSFVYDKDYFVNNTVPLNTIELLLKVDFSFVTKKEEFDYGDINCFFILCNILIHLKNYIKLKFFTKYENARYGFDTMLPKHVDKEILNIMDELKDMLKNKFFVKSKLDENFDVVRPITTFSDEEIDDIVNKCNKLNDYFTDLTWEKQLRESLDAPSFNEQMLSKMDNLQTSVDRVEAKIDNILSLNKKILEYKQEFKSNNQGDISDLDEELIEKLQNKIVEKIKEMLMESQTLKVYDKRKNELKNLLTVQNYEKLSNGSIDFLITGKIMYDELIRIEGNLDYSGVCLLLTKALETECKKRFYTGFINYMTRKYHDDYDKYPLWSIRVMRKGTRIINPSEFTLGTVPYALGSIFDRNDDSSLIHYMYDYCKDELFINKNIDYIKETTKQIGNDIETVKSKFRNPAAHSEHLDKITADECFNYLFKVQKLLFKLLSNCIY